MRAGVVVAGRFEIQRLAGEGGMGAVYRALDRQTNAPVALKVMRGQGERGNLRFSREAEVLRALDHPAIVRYVAHGVAEQGEPFLAMEWLEGEDLAQRLAREGLSLSESVKLTERAAMALGAAHAKGVVHRDIKPSNLFLPDRQVERVKVVDFGIARLAELAGMATRTGTVIGTPGYMAPEQARGLRDIDARADVFSLGCVLFECVTGRAAFVGETMMAILAKILLEDAPKLSDLVAATPALDAIVVRMLSKHREARPVDGTALARELASLGELSPSPRAGPGIAPPSITEGEQRLLSVVIASEVQTQPDALAPTLPDSSPDAALAEVMRPFDAHVERLLDGSVVVTLLGKGAATDQAARAARSASALRGVLGDAAVVLATGRGEVAGRLPVGEVIDRASRLLREACERQKADPAREHGVLLDEITAGLLDARFEVRRAATALELVGERPGVDVSRTLLGKPTQCVGRERELASLLGLFEECVAESTPRAVLVTAAAGVGKSRLRAEFLREIAAREAPTEVWVGRGDSISARAAFVMVAPFLRRAAGVHDGEPAEVRRRKIGARVSRCVREEDRQRVTEFLCELVGAPFSDEHSGQLRDARADAMLMGDQMKRAWEDFLVSEAAAKPLLIVLEDLHWGDLPSVSYLDAALRVAKNSPLMLLALGRPEVHDVFPKLWSGRGLHAIELGNLSARASEKLVRGVLGASVERERVERLVTQAAGNAFYLEELIRAEAEGKGDAPPETVLAMVQSRIEALEPETRRVLRAASAFGQVFWRGGVAALLGGDRPDTGLRDRLVELVDKEVVVDIGSPRFRGEAEYRFSHALVRDAAYSMLTDADRALGHRLAGKWLEAVGETDALVVAEHYERGDESREASVWYGRAAAQALEGNDFAEAIARVERAQRCGAEGEALGALRLVQMQAYRWRGEWAESASQGEQALILLGHGTEAWATAAAEVAMASANLGKPDRSVELATDLRALIERGLGDEAAIMAAARAAEAVFQSGRADIGESVLVALEARFATGAQTRPLVRARMSRARATAALVRGDTGAFVELCAGAASDCERAGDARGACLASMNVGYGFLEIGQYEESERRLRGVLTTAERMGLQHVAAYARHNLGMALARNGALDEALVVESAALEALLGQGDKRGEAASRTYLAEIHALSGSPVEAEREARQAIEASGKHPILRAQALAMCAYVLLSGGGSSEEALELTREAIAPLESLGGLDDAEALVRFTRAEALRRVGEIAASREAIELARDRLIERAEKISEMRWRKSFIERVPLHARTLELAGS